jgi:hypothetical protein
VLSASALILTALAISLVVLFLRPDIWDLRRISLKNATLFPLTVIRQKSGI